MADQAASPGQPSLPEGWVRLCSKAGETFFHHFETATWSRRARVNDEETQPDEQDRRCQEGWRAEDAREEGGRGGGGAKHKTRIFTKCSTAATELPSPEPPQELTSPLRRLVSPMALQRPASERPRPPERIVSDIWGETSPAASPQENAAPRIGARGRNGGDRWGGGCFGDRTGGSGGGGADRHGEAEAGGFQRRNSVRELAAVFGGGSPPRGAGRSGRAFGAGSKSSSPTGSKAFRGTSGSVATSDGRGIEVSSSTTSFPGSARASPPLPSSPAMDQVPPAESPRNLGAGFTPASSARASLPPPNAPDAVTGSRGSNRLDLLKERINSAGVCHEQCDEGGPAKGIEDGRRNVSTTTVTAASRRSGLALARDPPHGGLLSKSGTLRLVAAAGGGKTKKVDATGMGEADRTPAPLQRRNNGGRKSDSGARPTTIIPRAARGPSGESAGGTSSWYPVDIGGDVGGDAEYGVSGIRDDGGASTAGRQPSQTLRTIPVRPSIAFATSTAGVDVGQVAVAVAAGSTPKSSGTEKLRPGPSPVSVSGYSTPPSVERPRRTFFGSPREARGACGGDSDGGGSGSGGGNKGSEWSTAEKPEMAPGSLDWRETLITAPAVDAGGVSSSHNNARPKTSFAAAAAASRERRSTASSFRRRPRSSSASPPTIVSDEAVTSRRDTGGSDTSGIPGGANRTAAAAAVVAAAVASSQKKPSSRPSEGVENARPITSRSRSLPPGPGHRGSAQSRPSTSVSPSASGNRGASRVGCDVMYGRGGGSATGLSDGAPGYRAFVEARFHRGGAAVQILKRFNAKLVTELMCHTTASPRHALLSSTDAHLAEASIGMFRKIQSYMGDATADDLSEGPGDEATLRGILMCGRSNLQLACELYCQLVKQTHRCLNAENEPVLETDPVTPMSERMRNCAKNCFVPGTVFGGTIAETLRQEYYAVGVGTVTSPAPPEASESARVPVMVQLLVQTIELLGGVITEGIFRRPGHAAAKAALMDAISAGDYSVLRTLRDEGKLEQGQLPGDEGFEVDVYTVADTLKAWLRGMKDPLVPSESYERAVAAGKLSEGKGARQEEAIRVLLALPPPNSVTLDFLARFLRKVADHEKKNKMNAKGLAVVLSPNLLRNPEGDPQTFKANAGAEAVFVKSLIEGSRQ
eukprot:g14794.t1